MIFDGKKMQQDMFQEIRNKVALLLHAPIFTDILIGDDPVNAKYVSMKKKVATNLGFRYVDVYFPDDTPEDDILNEIAKLNENPEMGGIIVQLPLPPQYDKSKILNAVSPSLDADVLGTITSEMFYGDDPYSIVLPTAAAVMKILDASGMSMADKKILLVGQGPLVGKPVAHLLARRGFLFDVVTRETPAAIKYDLIKNADLIISATGTPHAITGDMVKDGVIIIDAGTSEMEGSIVGDIHFESVAPKAAFITPSPGGVGPVTVACLFENVWKLSKQRIIS